MKIEDGAFEMELIFVSLIFLLNCFVLLAFIFTLDINTVKGFTS